ncbi:MAG: hypothetical protein ABIS06_07640 [Vicinamibacterales bacterium]
MISTAALLLLGASAIAGQDPAPPTAQVSAQVKVSIGDTAAPPEWELSIPVGLNVLYGTEAGRVTMELRYPAKALNYVKIKATEKLKDAGYDVKAGKPVVTGETATIALEFLPASASAKTLPSGTTAILVFKVAVTAPEKTFPITVENIRAWGPRPAAATLTAASARAATFIVTPPGLPILSCFFYMH